MSITSAGVAHNRERTLPVVELGQVAFQIKVSIQAEKQVNSRLPGLGGGVATNSAGGVNFTAELNQISNKVKFALTSKYKPDWKAVGRALQSGNFNQFVYATMPGLEITAKGKKGIKLPGGGELTFQGGLDFKHLPILFRGFYVTRSVQGKRMKLIITVNVGPSLQGWLNITHRFGMSTLNHFLAGNRGMVFRNVATALASNGIIVIASAAAVSFGLFSLMALYAGHRARKGEIAGLSTWYSSAYAYKTIGRNLSFLKAQQFRGDRNLRDQLINAGVQDAVKDARKWINANNLKMTNPNDDDEAVIRWCGHMQAKYVTKDNRVLLRELTNDVSKRAAKILKN